MKKQFKCSRKWITNASDSAILLFILLLTFKPLAADSSVQIEKRITVERRNTPLREVLSQIEKESGYYFLYSSKVINVDQKVTILIRDEPINVVLDKLLGNIGISYKFDGSQIMLANKNSRLPLQNLVKGVVTDKKGEPMSGVTIIVKGGTGGGTITGGDGTFSIANLASKAKLVFTFIGKKTQEVTYAGQSSIRITMEDDDIRLEEVVTVGYSLSAKQKLTNSVSVAKPENIVKTPYANIVGGLQGRVAGVVIQQKGGEPGNVPSLSIRGGAEPLYIVDGVITSKTQFQNISPTDIQSISFLKDVASASIYGFGASNGVVQVVTKEGSGRLRLQYDYDLSFQRPVYLPVTASPIDILQYRIDAAFNSGVNPPSRPNSEQWEIIKKGGSPKDFPISAHKSVYKDILNLATPQQRHSLTLSGVTQSGSKIYVSAGAFTQDVNIKTSKYGLERYTLQTRLSHKFKESGIGFDANVSLQKEDNSSSPNDYWTIFSNARYFAYSPLYLNGKYYSTGNPLAMADPSAGLYKKETNLLSTQLMLSWSVPGVKGLEVIVQGTYRYSNVFNKNWKSNSSGIAQVYDYNGNPMITETGNTGPSLSEDFTRSISQNFQTQLNYNRTFNNHTVDFVFVYLFNNGYWDELKAYRRDFATGVIRQLDQGGLANQSNGGKGDHSAREGYAVTLKYDYASKYIMKFGARYDGFYGFAPGRKYGFFPSFSLAWNAGKEKLFRPLFDVLMVDNLKLHFSRGKAGSAPSAYGYLSRYGLNTAGFYNGLEHVLTVGEGALPPIRTAPTWQSTWNTDVGADITFFGGKLEAGYSWFLYKTTGFLTAPKDRYSTPLGKALPVDNADSEFRRGGLEFYADFRGVAGEFKYHLGGNITRVNTFWVKKYDESEASYKNPLTRTAQVLNAGNSVGVGYINQGFYQSINDILTRPSYVSSSQLYPGDISYKDMNGDGIIDGNDQVRFKKNAAPLTTFGITFGCSWRSLSLDGLLQGTGNKSTNLGYIWKNQSDIIYPIRFNYWKPDNRDAEFPRASNVDVSNNNLESDFWIKNSGYIRLKSLTLSYDMLNGILKRSKLSSYFSALSITLSGTNLLTLSGVSKYYIDPEDADSSLWSYPITKNYSIGIRVGF